jgi:hypothetical protein
MALETVRELHEFWRQMIIIGSRIEHELINSVPAKNKGEQAIVVKLEFVNGSGDLKNDDNGHA